MSDTPMVKYSEGGDIATDEHALVGILCWCAPLYYLSCLDCADGCWRCEGGMIPLTKDEALNAERPIVVVHNR